MAQLMVGGCWRHVCCQGKVINRHRRLSCVTSRAATPLAVCDEAAACRRPAQQLPLFATKRHGSCFRNAPAASDSCHRRICGHSAPGSVSGRDVSLTGWSSSCFSAGSALHTSAARPVLLDIVSPEDFHKRVIMSAIPVIVNFHADWCDPCKELTPMLEKLVEDRSNIALCSLDIENHVGLLQDFEVQAVPAVLAFFNGQVVDKFVGLVNRQVVTEFVDKVIDRLNEHASVQHQQRSRHRDND